MTEFDSPSPETLKEDIIESIKNLAKKEEITVNGKSYLSYLGSFVKGLFDKYQELSNKPKDPSVNYESKLSS
jgi:hypothetical protein